VLIAGDVNKSVGMNTIKYFLWWIEYSIFMRKINISPLSSKIIHAKEEVNELIL